MEQQSRDTKKQIDLASSSGTVAVQKRRKDEDNTRNFFINKKIF